ncbi:serine/arginine repetitive matrix protein 1-like [Penaeus chinensis]|uniref:serine/arginine repetitive matrix protein 1-like n=1 Tax=Penaeus chinensis TaxID=139456 RepID=UPI001FB6F31D|nr:serine/arginine repetitive matrix protein 1-like [Penaeus chinensis]
MGYPTVMPRPISATLRDTARAPGLPTPRVSQHPAALSKVGRPVPPPGGRCMHPSARPARSRRLPLVPRPQPCSRRQSPPEFRQQPPRAIAIPPTPRTTVYRTRPSHAPPGAKLGHYPHVRRHSRKDRHPPPPPPRLRRPPAPPLPGSTRSPRVPPDARRTARAIASPDSACEAPREARAGRSLHTPQGGRGIASCAPPYLLPTRPTRDPRSTRRPIPVPPPLPCPSLLIKADDGASKARPPTDRRIQTTRSRRRSDRPHPVSKRRSQQSCGEGTVKPSPNCDPTFNETSISILNVTMSIRSIVIAEHHKLQYNITLKSSCGITMQSM